MSNFISRRHLLSTGLAAAGATLATAALAADKVAAKSGDKTTDKSKVKTADAGKAPSKGKDAAADDSQLSLEALGTMLEAMGLKPNKFESSYNFTFPFKAETDWNMTMAATMSADEQGIWLTAFLAELPQTAADVPRTALLRLLAQNDEMGEGIFFAYMSKVRKIVLECFLANEDINSALFKECLTDLASRVAATQQYWDVAEWKKSPTGSGKDSAADESKSSAGERPAALSGSGTKDAKPIKTATKDEAATGSPATKKK